MKSLISLLALRLLVQPVSAVGQATGGCDSTSGDVKTYLQTRYAAIATDSDLTEERDVLGIPLLAPSDVGFVADSATCRMAATAYTQAEADSVSGRMVYVFRLGQQYLVVDKQNSAGEWRVGWLFDSAFNPIKRIGT